MAPNLTGVRAPSEALDSFFARHDSHDSLEVDRDEKKEALISRIDIGETTVPMSVQSAIIGKIDQPSDQMGLFSTIEETDYPSREIIIEHLSLDSQLKDYDYKLSPHSPNAGKSFSSVQDSVSNLPSISKSTDPKILNQNVDMDYNNPEEALLNHEPSVHKALKHRQNDLLELALKETISVAKEEEQWAVVEKRLVEDISFAQAVEELLQLTAEDNLPVRAINIGNVSPIIEHLARIDENVQLVNQYQDDEASVATSSGSPPIFDSNYIGSSSLGPILSKRTTGLSTLGDSQNIHYIISSKVSPPPNVVPLIQSTTITPEKTTLRLATKSSTKRRTNKPSTIKTKTSTTKSIQSTTESAVNLRIEPTGILRIPGHEPETPADIELTHHEQSKQFLEGQGARVLNDAMSAEGATAVILSSMCLLFIAFIGIAYFFTKQKKSKIMAKVAADIESQREKHLTTNGGQISYKLQPAPITTIKTTPITTRHQTKQLPYNPDFASKSDFMTTKPKSKSSSLYPVTIISNEKLSEKAVMAAKISEKSKMAAAASCSENSNMSAISSANKSYLPSYDESQNFKSELSFTPSNASSTGSIPTNKGKLWFSIAYDAVREALLLHVQQARFSQVRPAGRVWVEVCALTSKNDVHTKARTEITTATQSPVFNSRIAFQISMGHVDELLLRLTLVCGEADDSVDDLTILGSIILPLVTCDLTQKNTLIRDLH